ncbi:MAG: bifunctional diaminohydroxyphosphoribosylaminopyrimidine deaminase/5-amino-6-(5-phosphoribosylamino)uracil reductase RibD [Nitrospirae bacterium]|nr:bifunctional diaminohydroxyphosphoribosylaminopyrimidine deaminase/5-amino-6-(5-phosphoribosylamino)uracil reductase RibD [Nitrospirota bacterium]
MGGLSTDVRWMRMALRLAEKGRGTTSPNPMVGAVIVKRGRVVGQGYHRKAGEPHAEALALQQAGARARGATLYLNLEPCSHKDKRTPPCLPLIQKARPQRVVIAMKDPNRRVNGRSIAALIRSRIKVTTGVLEAEAQQLNEAYTSVMTKGRPLITVKVAQTLDGKIATSTGQSQWLTGEPARQLAHQFRAKTDAVMVGVGTILQDDPSLTVRMGEQGRDPHRIIVDEALKIPLHAKVLRNTSTAHTFVATTSLASPERRAALEALGATVFVLENAHGRVDLTGLMGKLVELGINSVMIEGGGELIGSALRAGLVDRLAVFIAPTLMGGQDAKGTVGGRSPLTLEGLTRLYGLTLQPVGDDWLVQASLKPPAPPAAPARSKR